MGSEGALLPLVDVLKCNDHVKKLNLSSSGMHDARYRTAGNGNSNARALASILKENTVISDVDLSDTGLDNDGVLELCKDLISRHNQYKSLNVTKC